MYIFKYPSLISIFVTNKCNLHCRHCCFDAGDAYLNELTTAQIKNIISEIAEMGIVCLDFSGGEPFLRDDIIDLIEYSYLSGIKSISVATNMLSITSKQISELKNIQKKYNLFYLRVSIDGAKAESHEWIRGKGTFKNTIKKFNELKEAKINIREANMVLSKVNYNEIIDVARLVKSFNVKTLVIIPLIPVGRAEKLMNYMLSSVEWKAICSNKKKIEETTQLEIFADSPVASTLREENKGKELPCMCGYQFVGVSPTGNYTVCPIVSEGDFSIYDMGIYDFWRKSKVIAKIRDLKNLSGKCLQCDFKKLCRGGCRGLAKCYYGDFFKPDPMCWMDN